MILSTSFKAKMRLPASASLTVIHSQNSYISRSERAILQQGLLPYPHVLHVASAHLKLALRRAVPISVQLMRRLQQAAIALVQD